MKSGLSVTIYGERWQKSPEWKVISKAWKGIAIYGEDYAKAIQSAKICLGLLSKSNRDLYTTRSMEIPYLGGLLCAERTSEHQGLYEEGEEAVFWSDSQECITVCNDLLLDEVKRTMIARRGQERAIKNKHLNQVVMQRIIDYSLH